MSANQQQLIKQYFQSLVDQFITDSKHKDIAIVFENHLGGSLHGDTLGNTYQDHTWTKLETAPGSGIYKKVPGSDVYKYTISFLNHYKDSERWRGTVAHEFSHLYLFSKSDNSHEHDDTFYSKMDYFEDWLDKKWNLTPRQDKGGDWNQHVDYDKRKQRENQYPSQPESNDDNYSPPPRYRDTPQKKERDEWSRLTDLIQNAKTLTELESNWQEVKNSSLYNSGKKIKIFEEEDIKEKLDRTYAIYKRLFCTTCLNRDEKHKSNCPNKCSKCSYSRLRNDTEKCHNLICENYCYDPKWDKEVEEREKESNQVKEFKHLVDSLRNSKNLKELEQVWKEIKTSSVYSDSKYYWSKKDLSNKEGLDNEYNIFKSKITQKGVEKRDENPSSPNNEVRKPTSEKNTNKPTNYTPWIVGGSIIGGILFIFLLKKIIIKLFASKKKKPKKPNE